MVSDESHLWISLDSARYDVVLVSLNDVALLESKIVASPSKPAVVPAIYTTTGADLTSVKNQYACVLKNENRNRDSVAVIDTVMESRLKGKPVQCKWSK